jgi:CRP-like cAMP-binding protein
MFNRSAYVSNLSSIPLFRSCTKRELLDIARRAETVDVTPGTVIVKEGDRALEFFVIVSGTVKVSRNGRTVVTLGPGDHFGELGLLADQRRDATVTAVDDVALVVLHRTEFMASLAESDTMSRKLLQGLATRLIELDKKSIA